MQGKRCVESRIFSCIAVAFHFLRRRLLIRPLHYLSLCSPLPATRPLAGVAVAATTTWTEAWALAPRLQILGVWRQGGAVVAAVAAVGLRPTPGLAAWRLCSTGRRAAVQQQVASSRPWAPCRRCPQAERHPQWQVCVSSHASSGHAKHGMCPLKPPAWGQRFCLRTGAQLLNMQHYLRCIRCPRPRAGRTAAAPRRTSSEVSMTSVHKPSFWRALAKVAVNALPAAPVVRTAATGPVAPPRRGSHVVAPAGSGSDDGGGIAMGSLHGTWWGPSGPPPICIGGGTGMRGPPRGHTQA